MRPELIWGGKVARDLIVNLSSKGELGLTRALQARTECAKALRRERAKPF